MVGIAVNALVRPPVYLRDTRAALKDAADEAQQILPAVAQALADGEWDGQTAPGAVSARARATTGTPGRPGPLRDRLEPREHAGQSPGARRGSHATAGQGYDDALAMLDQVAVHIAGVTRTVLEIALHDGGAVRTGPQITGPYADFLRHTAGRSVSTGRPGSRRTAPIRRPKGPSVRPWTSCAAASTNFTGSCPAPCGTIPTRWRRTAPWWSRRAVWPISWSRTDDVRARRQTGI